MGSVSPDEEQADVARHSAWKVQNAGCKVEAARFQIVLPAEINLARLAAQRHRPIRFADIDCPAAVAAELAGKAQEH